MRKETKEQLQNAFGKTFTQFLNGKPHSILCEYGVSTSTTSKISRGLKNPELSTIWLILESLNTTPVEFFQEMQEKLPKGFTTIDQ